VKWWDWVTKTNHRGTKRKPAADLPVSATLVATQHTPRLHGDGSLSGDVRYIGPRPRLATCSGAAWFHEQYIATVHLLGNALHTYRWDSRTNKLTLVQTEVEMEGLDRPENIACSSDGSVLAISNGRGGAVHLYAIDPETHVVRSTPVARIQCSGDVNTHGLSFSPCSRFLAFTTVDDPGYIRVHKIARTAQDGIQPTALQAVKNALHPLKPKGIDFSPDGRFVAICYAHNAGARPGMTGGMLAIHSFSAESGLQRRPVSRGGSELGLSNPDDLSFFPDGAHIVATNQDIDTAVIVATDPATGALGKRCMTLANPGAQLSYPHGTAVSRDGKYLAIANYGDDKLAIYALTAE
jgi:6-phosphogluconolactonase (cycloisomerase 2 family)